MRTFTYADVEAAAERIAGRVRPAKTIKADGHLASLAPQGIDLHFALEFIQHTGTFKARGAQNFIQAHREAGTLPKAGITIASGGNAGMACAWAAKDPGHPSNCVPP